MPLLTLLPLTDSFSAQWPLLATECDLGLVTVSEPSGLDRLTGTVGIIASAGEEDRIEPALLQIVRGEMPIAAVGAVKDHRLAAAIVRAGAAEYFALPDDYELLRAWLRQEADSLRAGLRANAFAAAEQQKYRFAGILGESPALQGALDRAARVIPRGSVTVLLAGETGTGKELIARAIHYEGPRRHAPFVDVNCAAIPEQLLESELFGHEKGAFTSATGAKPGLFELAHGGTLFLDEIGHLPIALQGKLLRALEERSIRRVGGTRTINVDVRVIAATHVNLAKAVRAGEFREDLYYRLNVVPIELPPLRARREDILPLAEHFLSRFATEYDLPKARLSRDAASALERAEWPGNIRELRNAIERAVLLSRDGVLTAADFESLVTPPAADSAAAALPFPAPLDTVIRAAVHRMLDLCDGNKSEAARRLGISRPRLLRLLDPHDPGLAAFAPEERDVTQTDLTETQHA